MDELDFGINKSQNSKIIAPISHEQATKMIIKNKNKILISNILTPLIKLFYFQLLEDKTH